MGVCDCNTQCTTNTVCSSVNSCSGYATPCSSNLSGFPDYPGSHANPIPRSLINGLMDAMAAASAKRGYPSQFVSSPVSVNDKIDATESSGVWGLYWSGMYKYLSTNFPTVWNDAFATYKVKNSDTYVPVPLRPPPYVPFPTKTITYKPSVGDVSTNERITLIHVQALWVSTKSFVTDCVCYANRCTCHVVCTCNLECSCNSDY